MSNSMCNNLEAAYLNRERIARGETNRFYNQQAHAIAQWHWGEKVPEGVILGELPFVGRQRIKPDLT